MAKETTFEHPPEGHVAILGYEPVADGWQAIYVDASGILQVSQPSQPDTPAIYNLYLQLADTEYEQALPAGTKKFQVRLRGSYNLILRFEEAGNGAPYVTVPAGACYWEDGLNLTGKSLWLVCTTAAQTAEIVTWS